MKDKREAYEKMFFEVFERICLDQSEPQDGYTERVVEYCYARERSMREGYQKYIKLLTDELDEVTPIANAHGWKSTRYEAGLKARAILNEAEGK